MDPLNTELLLQIESILKNDAEQGLFEPQSILSIIKQKGFYSCAYYDAVKNITTRDYQLFLSFICGTKEQESHIGESVNYKDASISRTIRGTGYSVQEPDDPGQTKDLKKHTDLLKITDKYRIHIPIFFKGSELIGTLSCSWEKEMPLRPEEIHVFQLIGIMFSLYWKIANDNLATKLIKTLKFSVDTVSSQKNLDKLLSYAIKLIKQDLNVNAIALFKYDWYSDALTKIDENTNTIHDKFLEERYLSGQFLTGKAWDQKDYRHIVDFDEFMDSFQDDINKESYEYHTNDMQKIKTILYSPFGTKIQYFLRLINRNDYDSFPFFASHRIVLNLLSKKLGELIDNLISNDRLIKLEEISKTAITNIASFDMTLQKMHQALSSEGVFALGMLAYEEGHQHFKYKYFSEGEYKQKIEKYCSWENDKFYKDCVKSVRMKVLRLNNYEEKHIYGHLVKSLYDSNISFVVVVPFIGINIKGFLLVAPTKDNKRVDTHILNRLPAFHKNTLKAYAGLIGGSIESADSHLTADNARRLIGHIGHEIQGPVSSLGQQAIYASMSAIEKIDILKDVNPVLHKEAIWFFLNNSKQTKELMQEINIFMSVAVDMALQTKGTIKVTFKAFDLSEVLKEAIKEAKKEIYFDKNDNIRKVYFNLNDAAKNMNLYIGDRGLIKKVFVNVFRNAIKYSMPPSSRLKDLIKIDIFGNPQENMFILQVINWGNPLYPDKMDTIFNAFERGDTHDRHKARRGMGLGLYIARTFMKAHGGNIVCLDSSPTLGDVNRRNIEGWKTIFEIRLPYGLKEGVHDARI